MPQNAAASSPLEIYEAALKPRRSLASRAAEVAWLALGLGSLLLIGWSEPWSARWFAGLLAAGAKPWLIRWIAVPLVMALRAVLLVETVGYIYHRFFQHVGFFTRRSQVFRRNQRFHWIHHMIIYPIGRMYRRAMEYVPSEEGVAWSWVVPGLIVGGGFLWTHGVNVGSFAFLLGVAGYAKGVVDLTHDRFHIVNHPWTDSPYFHRLEEIHLLHHWDQRYNFTICHPTMDVLFGTYLSPRTHREELKVALEDKELTVSDLINWCYLLLEATPSEYAAFISAARQHSRSLRKIGLLLSLLSERLKACPADREASELYHRAVELLEKCGRSADSVLSPESKPSAR
jgi:fatty acid hydroxylase family protein